ncbi:MAG TPA: hypothetical protein VF188_17530 [Longimicrobiales bacterium]
MPTLHLTKLYERKRLLDEALRLLNTASCALHPIIEDDDAAGTGMKFNYDGPGWKAHRHLGAAFLVLHAELKRVREAIQRIETRTPEAANV